MTPVWYYTDEVTCVRNPPYRGRPAPLTLVYHGVLRVTRSIQSSDSQINSTVERKSKHVHHIIPGSENYVDGDNPAHAFYLLCRLKRSLELAEPKRLGRLCALCRHACGAGSVRPLCEAVLLQREVNVCASRTVQDPLSDVPRTRPGLGDPKTSKEGACRSTLELRLGSAMCCDWLLSLS